MAFIVNSTVLNLEEELDSDGELEISIIHSDGYAPAWVNESQARDLIEKLKLAFNL